MIRSKGEKSNDLFLFFIFILVLAIPTTAILLQSSAIQRTLVPASILAFLVGATFEYRRISGRWHTVRWTLLGAYATSFFAFLPGKNERPYDLDAHIAIWPYAFCGVFALFAAIAFRKEIMAQLHEGITLLQALAFAYWLVDINGASIPGPFMSAAFVLVVLFTSYVIIHALLPISLSTRSRLWLSIWSSCILLVLAIDNIVRVAQLGYIEDAEEISHILVIVLNYVLLGVSSFYMMQNALMLFEFLPEKGESRTARRKRIRQLKEDHVTRYSDEQLPTWSALGCVIFCCTIYTMNFIYGWVHRSFMIWMVLFAFPFIHNLMVFVGRGFAWTAPGRM